MLVLVWEGPVALMPRIRASPRTSLRQGRRWPAAVVRAADPLPTPLPILRGARYRSSGVEDEVEPRRPGAAGVLHRHEQLAAEQGVARVARLPGEVELGGEDGPVRRLCLDVEVPGPARVQARHDRLEAEAALAVGEL